MRKAQPQKSKKSMASYTKSAKKMSSNYNAQIESIMADRVVAAHGKVQFAKPGNTSGAVKREKKK